MSQIAKTYGENFTFKHSETCVKLAVYTEKRTYLCQSMGIRLRTLKSTEQSFEFQNLHFTLHNRRKSKLA